MALMALSGAARAQPHYSTEAAMRLCCSPKDHQTKLHTLWVWGGGTVPAKSFAQV